MGNYIRVGSSLADVSDTAALTIREYFLRAFPKNFFNHIHLTTAKSLEEIKKHQNEKDGDLQVKRNPILTVDYNIDYGYESQVFDRTWIGERMIGEFDSMNPSNLTNVFYDGTNKIQMSFLLNEIKLNAKFDIMLDTLNQATNIYSLIRNSFPMDRIMKLPRRMEAVLPSNMMKLLSDISGYELNSLDFANYIRSESAHVITEKIKNASGLMSYFMLYEDDFMVRFSKPDVNDGERDGFDKTNYMVSISCEILFKYPAVFYLFDLKPISTLKFESYLDGEIRDNTIPLYTMQTVDIPEYDSNGRKLLSVVMYNIAQADLVDGIDRTNIMSRMDKNTIIALDYRNTYKMTDAVLNVILYKDETLLVYDTDYKYDYNTFEIVCSNIDVTATYRAFVYVDFNFVGTVIQKLQHNYEKSINQNK